MKKHYVYILTIKRMIFYNGMTNSIKRKIFQHKLHPFDGFTNRHKVSKLVSFEEHNDGRDAIAREEHMKGGCDGKK